MAQSTDSYMLRRDSAESKRLDDQHRFFLSLSGGQLAHSTVPLKHLNAIADIAAGTGIWLRQLASKVEPTPDKAGKHPAFVGFDISSEQYPPQEEWEKGLNLVVHDMTKPFPTEYHDTFDLVNVRFVSYVLQAADMVTVVENIVQIIRPGGYLQWQECDAGDSWTTPETDMARNTINYVIAEKSARGLLPGIATPLSRTIQSLQIQIPPGQQNPVSWSSDLMRIQHLQTVSTAQHPDPLVAYAKKFAVISAASVLLEASIGRKQAELANGSTLASSKTQLEQDVQQMSGLLDAIKRGEGDAINGWDFEMTWIVARKAMVLDQNTPWMAAKYPSL
ncbi:hypothetical protein MMC25_005769 [Agyrium rufum]|nr:hypothetical protein [Agyrium rufum]